MLIMRNVLFAIIFLSTTSPTYSQPARKDKTPYVRLLFVANCFDSSENSSFKFAAFNVKNDYKKDLALRQEIKIIFFDNARQVIDTINSQSRLIKSVDFFSHSQKDRIGSIIKKGKSVYRTSLFESKEALELAKENDHSFAPSRKMGYIDEIRFSKFAFDATWEIHGCKAGLGSDSLPDNICIKVSASFLKSGKQLAVVIGHGTRANPRINGDNGLTSPLQQDYRHGLRYVYYMGRPILATKIKGRISEDVLFEAIADPEGR
jgi:hypothetical protein